MNSIYKFEERGIKCQNITSNLANHLHSNAVAGITMKEYDNLIQTGKIPEKIVSYYNDFNIKDAVFLRQAHGNEFYVVDRNNKDKIKGKLGDAIICIDKKIPIMIFTADCVPIFIVDNKKKYIAAIHAGWRGTNLKITKNVAEFMINSLNSNPNDIMASIGPSIGHCCYDVSYEVANKFSFIYKDGKFYIDLWKENKDQLLDAGLLNEKISICSICTYCNDEFYSYRKDGINAGRQINIIEMRE